MIINDKEYKISDQEKITNNLFLSSFNLTLKSNARGYKDQMSKNWLGKS